MEEERLDRLERLFKAAQDYPPTERSSFLEAACADDEELQNELKSLLAADVDAERLAFLDSPPASLLDLPHIIEPETVPDAIGPYDIRRRIGRGGMGDVFLALRNEPFKQYVALKVLRPGLDGGELRQRFEMEQQILASLNHPNIARILDGVVALPAEDIPVGAAHGRVLAKSLAALRTQPPADVSSMDGYAARSADLTSPATLKLVGASAAGRAYAGDVNPGEAARIFTGAILPPRTDTRKT